MKAGTLTLDPHRNLAPVATATASLWVAFCDVSPPADMLTWWNFRFCYLISYLFVLYCAALFCGHPNLLCNIFHTCETAVRVLFVRSGGLWGVWKLSLRVVQKNKTSDTMAPRESKANCRALTFWLACSGSIIRCMWWMPVPPRRLLERGGELKVDRHTAQCRLLRTTRRQELCTTADVSPRLGNPELLDQRGARLSKHMFELFVIHDVQMESLKTFSFRW